MYTLKAGNNLEHDLNLYSPSDEETDITLKTTENYYYIPAGDKVDFELEYYRTPVSDDINLELGIKGTYNAPEGNNVDFELDYYEVPTGDTVAIDNWSEYFYSPDKGDNVELNIKEYYPPAGDSVYIDLAGVKKETETEPEEPENISVEGGSTAEFSVNLNKKILPQFDCKSNSVITLNEKTNILFDAGSTFSTGLINNITINMQGVSDGLIDVLYDYQFKVDFSCVSELSVSLKSGLNLDTNIQSSFNIRPSANFFISGQSDTGFTIYPQVNVVIDSSFDSDFNIILTFVSDSELLLVLNPDLEIVSYLEDYTDFVWNRKWREPDDFELTISKKKNAARYLVTDNYIAKKRGDLMHAGRIKRRKVKKEGRAESLTVSGIGLGEIFKNRIAFHEVNTGDGYDTQSGSAESVMKHYIDVNVINPENEDRAVSNLTLEKDKSRGQTINYRARFQKISEILYEISKTTGLGWDVILDLKNKEFVFKVLTAKIRTGVRLNPDMDSVSLINYEEDKSEQENTILIGGQGQGADRTLKEVNVSDL